jgi:hypothetical protein
MLALSCMPAKLVSSAPARIVLGGGLRPGSTVIYGLASRIASRRKRLREPGERRA